MKLETKYHGNVEIDEDDILFFQQGVPGFPDETKYVILPLTDDLTLSVLQSIENQQLAFVITDPFQFFKTYDFTLDDNIVGELEITSEQDVKI